MICAQLGQSGGCGGYLPEYSLRMTGAVLKPQCGAKEERRQFQRTVVLPPWAHPMLGVVGWAKGRGGQAGPTAFWQKRFVKAVTAL
jgi:hypothetical protein